MVANSILQKINKLGQQETPRAARIILSIKEFLKSLCHTNESFRSFNFYYACLLECWRKLKVALKSKKRTLEYLNTFTNVVTSYQTLVVTASSSSIIATITKSIFILKFKIYIQVFLDRVFVPRPLLMIIFFNDADACMHALDLSASTCNHAAAKPTLWGCPSM